MLQKKCAVLCAAALLGLAVGPGGADAQVGVSVLAGAYVPGNDFQELRDAADEQRVARSSTLGLGVNLDLGPLRLSGAYATGARLTEDGVQNGSEIGDGSVLGAAVAYVLRPIPRLLVIQPYLLGGIGLKREQFSFDEGVSGNPLSRSQSDVAAQIGVGADLRLGGIGVVAEITDYITRRDGSFGQHDAFVLIGVRIGL